MTIELRKHDRLVLLTSGGGHGDPLQRPAEDVLEDVLNGKVGIEAAEREYGVAIAGDKVDVRKTAKLRRQHLPAAA